MARVYTNLMRFSFLSRTHWRISWARAIQFGGLAIPSGLFRLVFPRIASLSTVTANCVCFSSCAADESLLYFLIEQTQANDTLVGWIGLAGNVRCTI